MCEVKRDDGAVDSASRSVWGCGNVLDTVS